MASRNPGVQRRTNEQWLSDLRGENGTPAQTAAYQDLGRYLFTCAHNRLRANADKYPILADLDDQTLRDFAQDFAQLTLEKIGAANGALLSQFRNESPFTAWAAKIANNVVLSELRKPRYRHEIVVPPGENDEQGSDNDPLDDLAVRVGVLLGQKADAPGEALERRELAHALARCLEALPDRTYTAFWAQAVEGRSGQEIADRLHTSRNAVFILLTDARKRLRACLQRSGYR